MTRKTTSSLLTALGCTPEQDRLYHQALALPGADVSTVAMAAQVGEDELLEEFQDLISDGVVRVEKGRVHVLPPAEALRRMLVGQAEQNARTGERLRDLAAAIPYLTGPTGTGHDSKAHAIDGEVSGSRDLKQMFNELLEQHSGDLCWLRPDQWQPAYLRADPDREAAMAAMVAGLIAAGRSSRAIYPVRALWEAPEKLQVRARNGEQIRVVPEVPTRLLVIGSALMVVPEPFGSSEEPRLIVRQRAVVQGFSLLFELMWERASPVSDLEQGEPRPDLRRLLLQQLATGAKDEQIARTLGISLRTVRRRIANLLIELGVDSRFQAGVEAVRRGWL